MATTSTCGPSVSVTAYSGCGPASEQGPTRGYFIFSASCGCGTGSSVGVSYALCGTASTTAGVDYTGPLTSRSVTVPVGSQAWVYFTPVDDALAERTETVQVTINSSSSYVISNGFAQNSILDNDNNSALTGDGIPVFYRSGSTFVGRVATFTDTDSSSSASDYVVSINWGDGNTSTGTVAKNAAGAFVVRGTHLFNDNGTGASFNGVATVTKAGGAVLQLAVPAAAEKPDFTAVVTPIPGKDPDGKIHISLSDPTKAQTVAITVKVKDGLSGANANGAAVLISPRNDDDFARLKGLVGFETTDNAGNAHFTISLNPPLTLANADIVIDVEVWGVRKDTLTIHIDP